jgi:hypothetical protein
MRYLTILFIGLHGAAPDGTLLRYWRRYRSGYRYLVARLPRPTPLVAPLVAAATIATVAAAVRCRHRGRTAQWGILWPCHVLGAGRALRRRGGTPVRSSEAAPRTATSETGASAAQRRVQAGASERRTAALAAPAGRPRASRGEVSARATKHDAPSSSPRRPRARGGLPFITARRVR